MMRKIRRTFIKEIETTSDLLDAIKTYKSMKEEGLLIFFDTETTGLNIKYDLPFLLPWGFIDKYNDAYVYCVDVDKNKHLFKLMNSLTKILFVEMNCHIFGEVKSVM